MLLFLVIIICVQSHGNNVELCNFFFLSSSGGFVFNEFCDVKLQNGTPRCDVMKSTSIELRCAWWKIEFVSRMNCRSNYIVFSITGQQTEFNDLSSTFSNAIRKPLPFTWQKSSALDDFRRDFADIIEPFLNKILLDYYVQVIIIFSNYRAIQSKN